MTDGLRKWKCWELLDHGEGPRARELIVLLPTWVGHEDVAAAAAKQFEELDMRELGYGCEEADGTVWYIEVKRFGTFEVTCQVKRHYIALKQVRTPIPTRPEILNPES